MHDEQEDLEEISENLADYDLESIVARINQGEYFAVQVLINYTILLKRELEKIK